MPCAIWKFNFSYSIPLSARLRQKGWDYIFNPGYFPLFSHINYTRYTWTSLAWESLFPCNWITLFYSYSLFHSFFLGYFELQVSSQFSPHVAVIQALRRHLLWSTCGLSPSFQGQTDNLWSSLYCTTTILPNNLQWITTDMWMHTGTCSLFLFSSS